MTSILIMNCGLMGRAMNPGDHESDGRFLMDFDPDYGDGYGAAWWTDDPAKAKRYASIGDAVTEARRQSTVRPIRADGKPNRPLSAYTLVFIPEEDAK